MHKKWRKIQSILEKRLTSGQYKVWIESLVPDWQERGLVLYAHSGFAADFLHSRLDTIIKEAVTQVLGGSFPVFIENRASMQIQQSNHGDSDAPAIILHGGAHKEQKTPCMLSGASKPPNCQAERALILCGAEGAFSMSTHFLATDDNQYMHMKDDSLPSSLPSPRPLPSPLPLPQMQLALPVERPLNTVALQEQCWRFSFEDFVVGPCNELAYAASRSMCEDMLHADILYLSSAPGLGKTHLMHAVGKGLCCCCNTKSPKVAYLTAEEFATEFFQALKSQRMDDFKARYRNMDLLLLEDVHFLQGKEKMQAELLATIKALRDRGSKVVFTSSFMPRDLKQLDDQLQSRLCAGLLAVIEKPDEQTRRKILRHKAASHKIFLPDDVEDALAKHIHADVRQIESCLQNLILKARLLNSGITLQMAFEVMAHYAALNPVLDMESIMAYVCRAFGLNREQLLSACRKQEYVNARNSAFYLARKHTDLSLEAIGRHFNRRHSTVLKGITSLEREISRESPLGRQLSNTLSMIERSGNIFG